ncbi:MAG: hypothetical protein AAFQ37_11445, partial [Bacteroidota bacterium]
MRGFLSFFDQLLANYLGQLANLRRTFSWGEGVEQTYFGQTVEGIPEVEKLLRFYQNEGGDGAAEIIVVSTLAYNHPLERDQAIEQLVNEFSTLPLENLQERLRIQRDEEQGTYSFVVVDRREQPILRGWRDYQQEVSAKTAGEQAALKLVFQATIPNNYLRDNRPANQQYSFRIIDDPASYGNFLRTVTENPTTFHTRRDAILDHLLARFNEDFADYVLLMYALNQRAQNPTEIIADKQRFLANYPTISRNRSRGFDYSRTDQLWDTTENLSGLEQRVSTLMGLDEWSRRNLSQFSVHLQRQRVRLVWHDYLGRILLRSIVDYDPMDLAALDTAREQLLMLLQNPATYQRRDCAVDSVYSYRLINEAGKPIAEFPLTFPSEALRDEHLQCTIDYFTEVCGLVVTTQNQGAGNYTFTIRGEIAEGDQLVPTIFWESEGTFSNREEALSAGKVLTAAARNGTARMLRKPSGSKIGYGIQLKTETNKGDAVIAKLPTLKTEREERETSLAAMEAYHAAMLIKSLGIRISLNPEPMGYFFSLLGPDGQEVYLRTPAHFPTEAAACAAGAVLLAASR